MDLSSDPVGRRPLGLTVSQAVAAACRLTSHTFYRAGTRLKCLANVCSFITGGHYLVKYHSPWEGEDYVSPSKVCCSDACPFA